MKLKLLVIKTNQLHEMAAFYSLLGLSFDYHKHEQGIYHYSTQLGETVFEIYPLPKKMTDVDTTTRLGFVIKRLDDLLAVLKSNNVKIVSESYKISNGKVAIIEDLDGRKIELTEIENLLNHNQNENH